LRLKGGRAGGAPAIGIGGLRAERVVRGLGVKGEGEGFPPPPTTNTTHNATV